MPATFTVTSAADSGAGSLRAALASAASSPGADVINFASGLGAITLTSGQLNVNSDVTISGPAAKITVQRSSSAAAFRIFQVQPGVTATLENLTISGGVGSDGGAIFNSGRLTVRSSVVQSNRANGFGGAIANWQAATGGVATLAIQSSTISNNQAGTAGAIMNYQGAQNGTATVTIDSSTLQSNGATNDGGAIYQVEGGYSGSTATIAVRSSLIVTNTSGYRGGGVFVYAATSNSTNSVTITSSTISGNIAHGSSSQGGGIYAYAGAPGGGAVLNISSSTIAFNSVTNGGAGGGIYSNASASRTPVLNNTIVSNNSSGPYAYDLYGPFAGSTNIVRDGSYWGLTGTITADPKLRGGAESWGGPTRVHALMAGSSALDAGNASLLPAGTVNDQRGAGYTRVYGAGLDIGAFEYQEVAKVTGVTSSTADGSYGAGSEVLVRVSYDWPVIVTGSPTLALNSGGTATYLSGSGSHALVFRYVVGAGENAADLDLASAGALALNGGSIKHSYLNFDADPTLPVGAAAGSLATSRNIEIDATAPTVTGVTSTSAASYSYGNGTVIDVEVAFSEPVIVMGSPTLALNSGGTATYLSGSGTAVLVFRYVVGTGQQASPLDVASAAALAGGSIRDLVGVSPNAAALALPVAPAVGSLYERWIVVDATAPVVTGVSSSTADGSYGVGAQINVTVDFSEPVDFTMAPSILMNTGGEAYYLSGAGSSRLTFRYVVGWGENIADLDVAYASALMAGTGIYDLVGVNPNAADLTLPVAPAAGSLGGSRDIVIDTTAPSVVEYRVLFGVMSHDLMGSSRAVLPWTITGIRAVFSEPISAADAASLGGLSAASLSGVGTNVLTWTLGSPLTRGTFASLLAGAGAHAVADAAGNLLGGGAGFSRTFSVLYGDYSGDAFVSSADMTGVRRAGTLGYDIFADLDGDGDVDANDATIARNRIGAQL